MIFRFTIFCTSIICSNICFSEVIRVEFYGEFSTFVFPVTGQEVPSKATGYYEYDPSVPPVEILNSSYETILLRAPISRLVVQISDLPYLPETVIRLDYHKGYLDYFDTIADPFFDDLIDSNSRVRTKIVGLQGGLQTSLGETNEWFLTLKNSRPDPILGDYRKMPIDLADDRLKLNVIWHCRENCPPVSPGMFFSMPFRILSLHVVPEPATMGLLLFAMIAVGAGRRW